MELCDCHFMACYPGLPRDIPWNSIELWSRQIENHRVPWDSMELGGRHFKWHKVFHGIPSNIPRNSMELWSPPNEISLSSMEFHGTLRLSFYGMLPWTSKGYSMEFHGTLEPTNKKSSSSMGFQGIRRAPFQMTQSVSWNIRWNSMELWCRQMKYHLVPWNSMELWDCYFMPSKAYSMEFHGTLESPNKKSPSSMGFHGNRRAPFQMTQVFHGIPCNIP